MATTFEKTLGRIAVGVFGTLFVYLASMGIYTLIYGNSMAYNIGYTVGCATQMLSSVF